MDNYLKVFREKALNLSQQEFADRLGVTQNTVSRWEADPDSLSMKKLKEIADVFGVLVTDILQPALNVDEPWNPVSEFWLETVRMVNNTTNEINITKSILTDECYVQFENYKKFADRKLAVLNRIRELGRKPSIAFTGASDVGKSTLINVLLGDKTLPAKWTPTTSAGTKLVHISDKPVHMDGHTTAVFETNSDEPLIQTDLLLDEEYFNKHLVAVGGRNLIIDFGTREGNKFNENRSRKDVLYTIVSYVDAPILQQCEIWDIPGVGGSSDEDLSDDYVANASKQGADILIYLSVSNQFMHNFDMQYLKEAITTLPRFDAMDNKFEPFENLFVVASQAQIVTTNRENNDLKGLIKKRIDAFGETLEDGFWEHLSAETAFIYSTDNPNYSLEDIQSRAFTFEREDLSLQADFKESLLVLLDKLSRYRSYNFKENEERIKSEYNTTLSKEIIILEEVLEDSEKAKQNYEEFIENKKLFKKRNVEMVHLMKSKAIEYKEDSHRKISDLFDKQVTIENIQKLIDEKDFGKKKEGREKFITWFQNELTSKSESIIKENSKKYSININERLDKFERESIKMNISSFDYAPKFIGVLSSVATYGAFAIYFSTLGNLGGYIFISQAVSLLTSLGFSVGGTSAVISTVAGIGGPMTLVIALAIIVGVTLTKLVGGSWQRTLAKKIVNGLEKPYTPKSTENEELKGRTFKEIILHNSDEYWNATENAVNIEMFNDSLDKQEQELKELASQNPEMLKKLLNGIKRFLFKAKVLKEE